MSNYEKVVVIPADLEQEFLKFLNQKTDKFTIKQEGDGYKSKKPRAGKLKNIVEKKKNPIKWITL